ncbi:MAG: P-type conjugative transfer protein VirB9 [Alphaproteobacteria bacterium]
MKTIFFTFIIIFSLLNNAYALREAKPTAIDKRIRVMVYNPNDVFKFIGYYGYQASIEFADGETVDTISLGDTVAWQIVPAGKRIFIKPMEADATTNMTVITNKRLYHFELHASEAIDINDPDMVFAVKFLYPDEAGGTAVQQFASSTEPDLSEPGNYNFNYAISGPEKISPTKIFDDGEFTYFQFKDKNAEIPAFFMVEPDGTESIINYRISGKYVVIERVISRYTLRLGKSIVCVFNENMPLYKQ